MEVERFPNWLTFHFREECILYLSGFSTLSNAQTHSLSLSLSLSPFLSSSILVSCGQRWYQVWENPLRLREVAHCFSRNARTVGAENPGHWVSRFTWWERRFLTSHLTAGHCFLNSSPFVWSQSQNSKRFSLPLPNPSLLPLCRYGRFHDVRQLIRSVFLFFFWCR